MSAVLDAAYQLVRDYPGGTESLGPRIPKNATTLRHEVNGTGSAKFALVDAVTVTVLSKDLRILNAFAAECDCLVLPMPAALASDSSAMQRVATLAREFGDVVGEVTEAAADGAISANELGRIRSEWADLVAAGQALLSHLEAKHAQGFPPIQGSGT